MATRPPQPTQGIPLELTKFCGRRRELLQLRGLLATDRLVTVTGTGGIGKTRLVMELAHGAGSDFPEGIWFVELARIESADLVATGIAEAIATARDWQSDPIEQAARQLSDGRQLLILDNCEHVLEGVATTVLRLLTECPALTVLATSREALHVKGERAWQLRPLRLPESAAPRDEASVMNEAVELFCDRAQLVGPGGELPQSVAEEVADICRRLDGLPLALELAAAWVPVLSLVQVANRLDDSLALLGRDDRGRPTRHHSIRAALDWSMRLLTPVQAIAFARLSVFVGGFSLEGAEAVLRGTDDDEGSTLRLIAALVARSLLVADTSAEEARYRLLEPVRQYAAEQLGSRPEDEHDTRHRHLAHLGDLAAAAEGPLAGGPGQPWLRRLDAELGNIRAALSWGFVHEHALASRLATTLRVYFWHRRLYEEGIGWAQEAARSTGRIRARALLMAGWYSAERGHPEPAARYLDEAYRLTAQGNSSLDLVMVLHAQNMNAYFRGDMAAMDTIGKEELQLARDSGGDVELMWALWGPAICLSVRGEHERALDAFMEALSIAIRLDNHTLRFTLVENVIETAIDLGDQARAAEHLHAVLDTSAVDDAGIVPYLIESAAILAIQRGDPRSGLRLLGAARAALTRSGYRETPDEAERRRRWIDVSRRGTGAQADATWESGTALSSASALEEVRVLVAPPGSPAGSVSASAERANERSGAANAFTREGADWSLTYRGVVARVRDSKGMRDIARLIAAAGEGVAAVDLVSADRPPSIRANARDGVEVGFGIEGDVGEALDAAARTQYRTRILDLDEDIREAEAGNDPERASRARDEREFLLSELGAAVGLGGRVRRSLDPAERARKAVTWRVRDSIGRIEAAHPALGQHLRRAVRTGSFCRYDPAEPTDWRL